MKASTLFIIVICVVYGLLLLLSIIMSIIKLKSDKNKYFKFNVVGFNSEKIEFAVKAKDFESAEKIVRKTLCTKDSDKWFEGSLEPIFL